MKKASKKEDFVWRKEEGIEREGRKKVEEREKRKRGVGTSTLKLCASFGSALTRSSKSLE